jgi:hypothetical protein
VTSTPAGINCTASCTADFPTGTSVTLVAANGAADGTHFTGWSGPCVLGLHGECTVTMSTATAVTANFLTQWRLTTEIHGTTNQAVGLVDSSPSGVSCLLTPPNTLALQVCDSFFDPGTVVTLTAEPGPSTFLGWGGPCSGFGTCTLTMTANFDVVATFAAAPPPDGINNTFGSAVNLGTLNCGGSVARTGTTSPAGTQDWLQVTPTCSLATFTLTGSSGIQFDVNTDASTIVASAGAPSTTLATSGTYYIRIYGATSTSTGTWTMTISAHS